MRQNRPVGTLGFLVVSLFAAQAAQAAPTCKGPNKNDPGCPVAAASTPATVTSATVDWYNQVVTVRGSDFSGATEFLLGGSATPLATANLTASQVDLPFDANLAAEVTGQGNYNLKVDGTVVLSLYFEDQVVDPAATGCPCETAWSTELGGLWGNQSADCLEVEGPSVNDPADISGTVLSVPGDATAYPQYPVGASFYPGQPGDSYCALVQVNGDATTAELAHERVNELQQADCATLLKAEACGTVNALP